MLFRSAEATGETHIISPWNETQLPLDAAKTFSKNWEKQQNAPVDGGAVGRAKVSHGGTPRLGNPAGQALGEVQQPVSGNPDYADTAAPGSGGDGGNDLGVVNAP